MIRLMLTASALAVCGLAMAKLPPLDDAAKAKAAETAARAAWQGKVDAYLTCKAQDRAVAHYKANAGSRQAAATPLLTPTETAAVATANAPATPVPAAPAPAGAAAANVAATTAATSSAAAASGTPVALAAPATGCQEPGPFAYTPAAQKPLETSGAHSPAANATSPPSVRAESATMAPAGPATSQSKKP